MEKDTHEHPNHDRADNAHFTGNPVCDEFHPMSIKAPHGGRPPAVRVPFIIEALTSKKELTILFDML